MDILIVEDELEIAQLIQLSLEKEGFSCRISRDGISALRMFQEQPPDLIILDLMIPGLDGLEVCARIRHKPGAKDPYILMLTAKGEEIDRVIGLSTGADDYMVKPFSPRELVARVRALLRRSFRQGGQNQVYRTQNFIVDVEQRTASRQKNSQELEILDLTSLEFNLLSTFVSNPGRVWNRSQLIDKLWGDNFFGDERVVDTHVARLRKKIEPDQAHPSFIKTVVGVGYKFEDPTIV
ncbi:response regulator transcription factor [Plectonema radiosum NIES-515]|uniref:Response regulator transcription factor n=1 Tax=Plectonema radiosum NIES-515 TaxID=2986073 RepID=A0ABT3AWZ2_9CYAN|nr:response regulator transcription factor [Plectonema radiosum]MCV3213642.1 response regulator transcription factor [Plectonema radiosum NIES-515]